MGPTKYPFSQPAVKSVPWDARKYKPRGGEENVCSCSTQLSSRNLVVCIDGTSNQFSVKNTNVIELYSRLVKDEKQLTYYNSGIGTYVKDLDGWRSWISYEAWKQSFLHTSDLAIAWSFKDKVLSAYQWLSENYENGDKIFLFGFSRGAYQVRVIAGMIDRISLLYKSNNEQIPFAYELYTKSTSNERRDETRGESDLSEHFKKTLSREIKVHFVGAWDTVSSIGAFRKRSFPETTTGMEHVCAFRHALALDELRVKFLPEYANGGAGPGKRNRKVKEVWFSGSHSDIGGGNIPNLERNHFGPALHWMEYEAVSWGLKMRHHQGEWSPVQPHNSMKGIWHCFELAFISRLSYEDQNSVVWR
ncbi:hypothetical protein GYMLUDRAFT_180225 [Collybiopsis luxurians FD-317 M1]|uniref:T6SS Phospholipase effector Tle1-like catalytic domain-containing protein n=1 Tax=Collybiopsis luxurians FD-317 M1 TaxID=944289 RepID=A0A0D0CBS6_9AGAR|nr:hypothetical protein GYMLUDRAFT_180225 [Collybiopsis luxurians FD-317 M1]